MRFQYIGWRMLIAFLFMTPVMPAFSQSTTMTFTNSQHPPVPLLNGSNLSIDSNGNVSGQCVLGTDPRYCSGLAPVAGSKAEVTTLVRADSNTDVVVGETITLSWTTASATVCNALATPVGVTNWVGLQQTGSGTKDVGFSAEGTYNLALTCYNDNGSAGAKNVQVTVGASSNGNPGSEDCTGMLGDPLVKPSGYTMYEKTWTQAFFNNTYPSSGSHLAPVGSYTLKSASDTGPPIGGKYISVPFIPDNVGHSLLWQLAQPIVAGVINYNPARPASAVYVTISTCRGDFRLLNATSTDVLLRKGCRKLDPQSSIAYSPTGGTSVCKVIPGNQYYLNFLFADPTDGLIPTEYTCAGSNTRCEANFSHN